MTSISKLTYCLFKVQAHPKAKEFRTKPLPNFDSLCMVWGRDRATGEEGECLGAMEEQVNLKDDKLPETPHVEESELSQTNHETVTTCNDPDI